MEIPEAKEPNRGTRIRETTKKRVTKKWTRREYLRYRFKGKGRYLRSKATERERKKLEIKDATETTERDPEGRHPV
jgi:hypothetical protein